jgi:amino acid adenylation domain-containing protein/thioester reductase-like protein
MSLSLPNISELSPAKQELLRQRLLQQNQQRKPEPQDQIQRQPRDFSAGVSPSFPLSFAQERLWFLHQFEPESTAYNIPMTLSIQGMLNLAALEHSLNTVIQRHEILRTVFASHNDQPVQVILPKRSLPLEVIDLGHLNRLEQDIEVQHLAQQEAQQPFNLETGPLLRSTILRLNKTEQIALFTMHHSISDAWSMQVLIQEVIASYTAFITGKSATLPDLPIQYADFAVWQRQWLQENHLEAQLAYWQQQLSGTPSLLDLPTKQPRPALQTYRGATQSILLPPSFSQDLKTLARQEGATLFMVLLAAFKVLLYRYTQQEDLWIGTPIANRNRSQLEGLIGFFVNTQILRTQVKGTESFREFLSQVKRVALEAYAHQDLPFEQLVEALQPERDPSRNPLFDVMFILQNAPTQALDLPGLSLTPLKVETQTSNFDLTLATIESEQGLKAQLEYSTDLFNADTIERLLQHFQTLLAGIIAQPDQTLAHLPLLTSAEQQLLRDWNNTPRDYPPFRYIHELIEAQVKQIPDVVAVVFNDQALTYRELNDRANQVAHTLIQKGVGPEVRVGLCLERSLEPIVGVLGILKAGGAYVPLDPTYPVERLNFILTDADISLLLTQKDLLSSLPTDKAQVILVEDIEPAERQDNPQHRTAPDRLAYAIYTSGSTGQPKGVMIEHQSLINAYFGWQDAYQLKSQATTHLQMANFAFDVFTGDWVRALCSGGKLVLCPRETLLDPKALYTLMQQQQVNCAEFVPAVLRTLIEYLEQTQQTLGFMNLLICGSDRWTVQEYQTFRQYCGSQTRLINSFGLTEATIDSSYFEQTDLTLLPEQQVPIGKPFANTQLYILDTHLNPVPVGVKGELYIGGRGLARGYWNRPELTAERFIPNPFNPTSIARLYRTGDLARFLPDGNIEFLDRLDYQVKIRGVRIELGEIEAAIAQSPLVQQAIVTAHEANPSTVRLVAYVVLNSDTDCDHHTLSQTLRNHLAQSLTDCMIPSAFVILDAIPLTPNGKVDRRALPVPDKAELGLDRPFVAPQTALEQAIAAIWQQLLDIEAIGIHDNFFALGGHSLLATRVISKLRQELQSEIPLRCLFELPTISELAQYLEQSLSTQTPADLTASPIRTIPKRNTSSPCTLSFAQDRLYFLAQLEPNSPAYNIPCTLRIRGLLRVEILERCFAEIQRRHDILRTRFIQAHQQSVQVVEPSAIATLSLIELQHFPPTEQEAEIHRLAQKDSLEPFHLEQEPLLRIKLLRLDAADHILLLTIHHIISDAWSSDILTQELSALYEAFSIGNPSPLPELPIQYADFALWQRDWLQGDVLQTQLNYWSQQLKDAPPVLALPTDRPRPPIQSANGAIETVEFPPDLSKALQALAQQESVTLYMVLLAAFKILLYRYTGQTDILVGSAIANRNRPEIEGLIGFFVNTLVLRTQLSGHLNFRALLAQVRQVTLDAYEHQDLPFEKLVAELNIERNLSHQPLCQVAFELQNLAPRNPKIPGLHFEILEPDVHNAKYDLTLFMSETDRGLVGSCEYNTDLFDRETITCFLEHYRILLESILAHPDQKISTLPLLSHFERQQLFIEWNNPYGSYPKDQTVQQFFEVQVERTPNAIAAIDEDQCISYQELNRQANRIAHYLISLGVKADKLVGLCFERSINLIATLLGVLKAGGAYVPIDPTYPQDRIRDILEDARLQIVLTQTNLTHHFQQSVRPLCLDDSDLTQQCDRNPPPIPGNQHLSYLIYTSGSTGKPKGTMIEHRALANYTQAAIEHYGIRQADRILQFASISFDAAAEEIFPTLARGATLVLRTEEMLSTIPTFLNRCREQYITVLDLPTAFWHLLVTDMQRLNLTLPNSIRLVVIGGEAASAEHLATWQQLAPQVRLVNSYGPTETTIVATTCELSPQRIAPGNIVPIGKPIARGQTYVLDTALQPLPIGVPGELYIGGAGLARGYLHQPEQTAKAFIPHPFSPDPQARLYRTGDRVRYRRDSNLEFLGRLDEQVKIRGFRIELGEIEALLRQQSGVKTALVVAYEDHGTQSLAAYIVPDETLVPCIPPPDALPQSLVTPPLIRQLRSQIKAKLPSYMMPSTFICLDTLPLTPNGKVNRQALPRPESSRSDLEQTFIAPRNPLEEQMAQLWTEVLGLEQIGIHDNFFELGGHSLLTTQLILKVKETFQVELPLRILFEAPTIASLVENIQTPTTSSPIGEDTVNLKREATLEEDIRPKTPFIPSQYDPTSILLTGATGFLGAFLLYELLQQTQAKVYCLVRATSLEAGHQKLQDCLKAYLIWQDSFESRIIPILGDLALPRLGITDADYHTLSRQIDIIYHNGAWVHHIYPYSVLKPTNVLGTKEIIKLACETKTKPIHFISTPNVFSSTGCTGVRTVLENESIDCEKIPKDGYIQTKWVAEKLIQTAAQRGLPICIYRPARISGHSQTGVFNPNDFLYRLIIGCVQMGSVPEGNLNEDIIPIDYASQAIVYLSQQQSFGQAFHMVNPQLLEIDMLLSVLHSCGYLLPQIPYEQWRTTLVNLAEQSPEQALSALLPFFPPQTQHQNQPQTELKLDCQNTLAGLADSGITCPALDETLLRTYLSYLIQSQTLAPA